MSTSVTELRSPLIVSVRAGDEWSVAAVTEHTLRGAKAVAVVADSPAAMVSVSVVVTPSFTQLTA